MTLSYGKESPQDMLAKAERDLARLEAAELAQNNEAMSDSLFDLAIALTSLKDWLKEHPGASFSPAQVEKYVGDSIALNTFRDVANGGKHRIIRNYEPQTMNVTTSAVSSFLVAVAGNAREPPKPSYRLKIFRKDGASYRAVELGQSAVREWRDFLKSHGITA
jgi:hypothetical protein